jgi:hypothetical protein
MFSIVFPGGGPRHEADLALPAQYRLVGTVVIGDDLVGRVGADFGGGYNPFDLYGVAKPGRGQPLPPHLVFAELDRTEEEACAFLNAYGPLDGCSVFGTPLTKTKIKAWEKASAKSSSPEIVFGKTLGEVPLLPPPGKPQDDFIYYRLDEFWRRQSEFELALRLDGALNSAPAERYSKIRRALKIVGTDWDIRHGSISGFGLDELPLLGLMGQGVESQYINAAVHFVRNTVNWNLSITTPRLVRKLDSVAVEGVWGCYSLLGAMYLMLFLDIAHRNTRIVQCEKCGSLFYSDLERVRYCSAGCENRDRALRAYYRKKGGS